MSLKSESLQKGQAIGIMLLQNPNYWIKITF